MISASALGVLITLGMIAVGLTPVILLVMILLDWKGGKLW